MSAERRRILGEYWTRVALLEHASIAAFLRFSLELLAVGAPHAFLDEATRAIADETRHARLAFGLATAYLGYGVGAGELSAPDALDRFDLRTVTVETLLSGCIGETLAAIAASEALERCEDETVRTVLVEIVRDETRHAKLAWRFVQWATAIDPMLLDELLELTEVERSRPLTREWLPPAEERWRRRHGMHEASITLRDRVLTEIVAPCLQTLRRERPVGRIRSAPTAHPPA
jgi:hypothetical protein